MGLGSLHGQDYIQIGGQTGAQIFFDSTRTRVLNFGITTAGATGGISISNIVVYIKRDAGVTEPVVATVYNNFGGTGTVIATGSLAATNFSSSQFDGRLLPLGANLSLGAGAYSVVLSSATTGGARYFYKASPLLVTADTNGTVLSPTLWTEDSNVDGTAGTNLQTTTPILADYMVSTTNVNFGNYRVGATLSTNASLTNTAFFTTNNLTESLVTAASASNGATVSGLGTNFLRATNTTNFTVGLSATNVGTNIGTVTLNYTSVTNGSASTRTGGPTNIGSQTITVSGVGYRLAQESLSTTNVNLGNFRVVDGPAGGTVVISNTAINDGYSEGLGVSNTASTGAATVSNVPAGLIAAGGGTNVGVGLSTSVAGTNSGTLTFGFVSDGAGTSGLAATNIGSQSVNVFAVGYDLAQVGLSGTNVSLGNFRLGTTNTGSATVTVSNTAATNGYSESLGVGNGGTTGGATVSGLPGAPIVAGAGTNLSFGLGSATNAGTNSGTVTLVFTSDGTGTSGLAATNLTNQTITVSGVGYRLAQESLSTTNLNLGNFRLGASNVSGTLGLTNTAPADGFSEALVVSSNASSGGATVAGLPSGLIAAGNATNLTVGLASVTNAGTNSGTLTLGFASDGTGTSGLSATNLGTTNVNVFAVGYRLAQESLSTTNVNLGNFRVVDGPAGGTVVISNTAINDGYSEGLGVSNTASTGAATVSNVPAGLIAAGGGTNVGVGLSTSVAGTNSGTLTFGFVSDGAGTSGLAATNIGSQSVNVFAVGYDLAQVGLSGTNVSLGNFRLGTTNTGSATVTVSNTAATNGYSESLGVGNGGTTGGATVSGLPGAPIVAGAGTNLSFGLGSATNAGTNSGTVTLVFTSDGTGTSGLAATNLTNQTITVSGVGYRLAQESLSTTNLNLGNFRLGASNVSGTLGLTNTAPADGFSEALVVSSNASSGGATVAGLPSGLIAAGNATNLTVGLASVTNAGTNSGTLTLGFASDGTGTSGLSATNLGTTNVNVFAVGYRLAQESLSTTNVNLGRFHVGYTTNNGPLVGILGLTNTAPADGYSEALVVSSNASSGGATVAGLPSGLIAAGNATNLTVGLAGVTNVGTNAGTITLGFASDGTGTSGLSATNIGSQSINVFAQGYSGQSIWITNGSGLWTDFGNWDTAGGTPGLDDSLSANDSATFGPSGSGAVVLDTNASLLRVVFTNSSASYAVSGSGLLTLAASGTNGPTISNRAGSHLMDVALSLPTNVVVDALAGTSLDLGGAVGGVGGVFKSGAGQLRLSGSNTYAGGTTVDGGMLVTAARTALGTGAVVVNNGGTLAPASGTPDLSISDTLSFRSGGAYLWSLLDNVTVGPGINYTPTIELTGDLAVSSGAIFQLDLGGSVDSSDPFWSPGSTNSWTVMTGTNSSGFSPGTNFSLAWAAGSRTNGFSLADFYWTENSNNLVLNYFRSSPSSDLIARPGGTQITSGTNTYGAVTYETNGRLIVDPAATLRITNPVVMSNGSTTTVNGVFEAPSFECLRCNIVAGSGTMVGNFVNLGRLRPGNSPGTLTIVGNFTQGATGLTEIEVETPGNFDRLVVSGAATLAGGLQASTFGGGNLSVGDAYQFLAASGGIAGGYDFIATPSGLRGRFVVSADSTQGTLYIAPASYTAMAATGNQANVARALDTFIPGDVIPPPADCISPVRGVVRTTATPGGDRDVVSAALDTLAASQYPAAFEQLMPTPYASLPNMAFNTANALNSGLFQRLWVIRINGRGFSSSGLAMNPLQAEMGGTDDMGLFAANPGKDSKWGSFVDGNGVFANGGDVASLGNYRSQSGGVTTGAFYSWNDRVATGVYAGYQGLQAQYDNGQTVDNAVRFGVFGTYDIDYFYFNALVGGAYHGYTVDRTIDFGGLNRTATGRPGAGEFDLALGTGYDLDIGDFSCGPFTTMQYTYLGVQGFNETGAGALDLQVDPYNSSSLLYTLGAQAAYNWKLSKRMILTPTIFAGWQHEFLQDGYQINTSFATGGPSSPFSYDTGTPARDNFYGGVGVTLGLGANWQATAIYSAFVGPQNQNSQNLYLGLGVKF